jgi:hypothetical protein
MDLVEETDCNKPGLNRPGPGFLGTAILETVRKWNHCKQYVWAPC